MDIKLNMNKKMPVDEADALFRLLEEKFNPQYRNLCQFIRTRDRSLQTPNKTYSETYL
jgi:hypothetical protein